MKVGIIGFGGAGQAHYRRFITLPGVVVDCVFEPKPANRARWQAQYPEVHFTSSREELLDRVEVVSICTPDHVHVDDILACIAAGRHTLVEKPMVTNAADAGKIAAALGPRPNMTFGIHHQMRFVPAFAIARGMVERGELGAVVAVEADYLHDMRQRATRFDDWRVRPESVQSVALGGLSHTLDLLRWVAGVEVAEVYTAGGHIGWPDYPDVDTLAATLQFRNGALGRTFKTIASAGPQRNSLAVYGTQGQVRDNVHWNSAGIPRLTCVPRSLALLKRDRLPLPLLGMLTKLRMFQNYPLSSYEHDEACLRLLRDFLNAARTGRPFAVGVNEGRRAIQLCCACIESQRSGKPVHLPDNP